MTSFHFTAPTMFAVQAAAGLSGGALIGAAYFWMLHRNIRLLAFGRAPLVAAAVQVGRFAFLAGLLAAITACAGSLPLIATAAGILAARTMMTMRLAMPT
jgi:N-ATPase, AtpR subunit